MKIYNKTCEICGTEFKTTYCYQRFCCEKCRDIEKKNAKNRPFTRDTPFLCQKWKSEGMSVRKIAEVMNRSTDSVKKALAVRL